MDSTVQPTTHPIPAQATELALLVDLEARWENLRLDQTAARSKTSTSDDLKHIQKVYDAFHVKLVAYNKQYRPAHVPELLLNSATRLQVWCRGMTRLFRSVQHDAAAPCPLHCMEKAYRCADRIADRIQKPRCVRPAQPASVAAAVQDLERLTEWCEALMATPTVPVAIAG